jgi:hypothetical protein
MKHPIRNKKYPESGIRTECVVGFSAHSSAPENNECREGTELIGESNGSVTSFLLSKYCKSNGEAYLAFFSGIRSCRAR